MGFFFAAARGPSSESCSILMILLILSNCFLKIRIHFYFLSILWKRKYTDCGVLGSKGGVLLIFKIKGLLPAFENPD